MDYNFNDDEMLLYDFFKQVITFTDEEFIRIIKPLKKRCYKKGDAILKEGEVEIKTSFVLKGTVHQYIYDRDEQITINISPSGLTFNSLKSYKLGTPSVEIHEALTDVELLYIEKDDLEKLLEESYVFRLFLYRVYENVLLDRENRMFLLQHKSPTKRFELFIETVERAEWLLNKVKDKYIASYLNMTPQQYCREKSKYLKREKLIK